MNAIWEQINSAGLIFVEFALPMLVQSSVLILILLLADFALRKKVRAVFRYGIWLLVLIKLVLPTSLSAPLSLGYFFGNQLAYVDGTETTTETAQTAPAIVSPMIDSPRAEAGSDTSTIAPTTPTIEPAVTEPVNTQVVSATPLSWQGAVFLAWLTVVLTMGLLLLQRAIFVRGLVAQAKEANSLMNDTFVHCRERMGVKRKIGLKVSANAASPAVCGLFRPVILVPQNLTSSLSPSQLRAVLLHELAHIRRGDLWVNLAQTVLQIIYFYNPLLWLANCVIRRGREQAVDEMVLVAMGEKAQQYPQTLVDVAKLAFKRPALSLRLIGVVESKSALAGRIKHILNRPMPKRAKLGILGLAVVIITAAILLPMAKSMPGPPELNIKGIVKDAQTGEPIAGARVFDDGYGPKPNWEQIKANVRSEWGAITNSAGEYSFLTWPEHHSIKVEAPDYKPERQSLYDGHFVFNKKDEETFDFALEPEKASDSSEFNTKLPNGVTVELIGICEHPSEGKQWWRPDGAILEPDHAPSDHSRMTVKPDETEQARELALRFAGQDVEQMSFRWKMDMATRSSSHPFYVTEKREKLKPLRNIVFKLPQNLETLDFSIGIATGEWKRVASGGDGRTVSGTNDSLTDSSVIFHEAVKEKDTVRLCATHLLGGDYDCRIVVVDRDDEIHEPIRSSNSGSDMRLCKGFFDLSPDQIEYILLQARPYDWVEFKNVSLRPGIKTEVQVEIEPEKPAEQVQGEGGASKQLSSGGGHQNLSREQRERLERLRANRQSLSYKNMQKLGLAVAVFANDHKGRCPSNLSDLRKYIADEQIFDWINRNVVYLGKNQQYGDPPDAVLAYDESMLKKTRQETNVLYNDAHVSFEKSEWLVLKATSHQPGQKTNMQVKDTKIAPGSSGEAVDSSELTGRVVDENGNTVADAQVAISTEKIGVLVSNGKLQPIRSGVENRIVQTDSQGMFDFGQIPVENFDLIVAHEKGFAMVESEEFVASGEIHLQLWGHIDGQLAEGRKAAGNKIWMSSLPNPTWFRHKREYRDETKCDESGHFVFDKVPSGWFEVGYLTRSGKNSWSITSRTPVVVKTGQTTKMRLGGEGRPVTGRFVPPEGYDKSIYFGEGSRSLQTVRPQEPRPDNYDRMTKQQQRQWREQWHKTDEYKKYRDDYWHHPDWRQYTFFIEKDGSFQIDDVIAGKYKFWVGIEERDSGKGPTEEIAGYYGTVEVPEMPGGRSDEPLDLGELELTMHNPLRVGDIAPLFEAKTLDGKDLRLIDYRGKFVLLSFWQPVFHPEKQQLQELYDTYGGNRRLEIIGLGGNDTLEEVKNYVRENAIPWPQIYTGEEFKSGIAKDYGGFGIFLIDPDGRIIAKDLRGEKLKSVVSEALEVANVNKPDVQVED